MWGSLRQCCDCYLSNTQPVAPDVSEAPALLPVREAVAALGAAWAAAAPATVQGRGGEVADALAAALLPGTRLRPQARSGREKHPRIARLRPF